MVPKLSITKLDAARRQMETAVQLYAADGEPVSIHTLTCATREVLSDVAKARGAGPQFIPDSGAEYIRPEKLKDARAIIREPQNFFKHAKDDPDGVLEFPPGATELLLFEACLSYQRLTGETRPWLVTFSIWITLQNPDLFRMPEHASSRLAQLAPAFLAKGRSGFFGEMIEVLRLGVR